MRRVVSPWGCAVLPTLALVVLGCGRTNDAALIQPRSAREADLPFEGSSEHTTSLPESPFEKIVRGWRDESRATVSAGVLHLANQLGVDSSRRQDDTFYPLVRELARQQRFDLIEYLDSELTVHTAADIEKKDRLQWALAVYGHEPGASQLMRRLAPRYPESIPLAPYRADGLEYLIALLEDAATPIEDRVLCAGRLALHGNRSHLSRLRRLRHDPTPWITGSSPPYGDADTLGVYIQRCLRAIEERADR